MTPDDLAAILARAEDARRNRESYSKDSRSRRITNEASATDVPALLAEVERLRGEVAELTCDEFCLYGRERNEARARIERVRSAIRLISPDHITPQGASILNAALADPKGEA